MHPTRTCSEPFLDAQLSQHNHGNLVCHRHENNRHHAGRHDHHVMSRDHRDMDEPYDDA